MTTSYYRRYSLDKEATGGVSIALRTPTWANVPEYKQLSPPWELLKSYKGGLTEKEYIDRYNREVLDQLDPLTVYKELRELAGGHEPVLLCYESYDQFCHRHLAAEWFENNLPIDKIVEDYCCQKWPGHVGKHDGGYYKIITQSNHSETNF